MPAVTHRLEAQHWGSVEQIYRAGIATGHATFEAEPPTWEQFDASKHPDHRLVAIDHGDVVGWAAVAPVSQRPVYAGVVEHSLYVAPDRQGNGLGRLLLDALIASCESGGIWTIQSGVFPENVASLRLHAAAGFAEIGRRERLGLMSHGPLAGHWRDVVMIERRSPVL